MKLFELSAASFLMANVAFAQLGYVVDAAGGTSYNVLAPQMLATVYETLPDASVVGFTAVLSSVPYVPPVYPPTTANVYIRPLGSSTSVPIQAQIAFEGPTPNATFVVPAGVPVGSAELYWQVGSRPYHFMPVTVARSNFTLASGIRVLNADGSSSPIAAGASLRPGQTAVLSGSGLGYGTDVSATLAGVPAKLVYAGHGPAAGYDTVQVQIPAASAGCNLPLSLMVGQATVSTSVDVTADGSPCGSLRLSANDLNTLNGGGSLSAGVVNVTTALTVTQLLVASREETINFSVGSIISSNLAGSLQTFGCAVSSPPVGTFGLRFIYENIFGDFVTLTNSQGAYKIAARLGGYHATPADAPLALVAAPVVAGGRWTWTSPGSSALPASSFSFNLPNPLQLKEDAILSFRRDQDRTITWSGETFDAGLNISLVIAGSAVGGTSSRSVTCGAAARSGTLVIPAALLADFDAASIGSITATLQITGLNSPGTRLVALDGSTQLVLVNYLSSDNRPIEFQ